MPQTNIFLNGIDIIQTPDRCAYKHRKEVKNISGNHLVRHNCHQETVTECSQALEKSKSLRQMQDEVQTYFCLHEA